jgi:N-acetylglucosaminyl-diphospho-decaprenol L-rhamnosyltransferase
MTVHVLIVHYNTAVMTARLAAAMPACTDRGTPVRVHVLDNASRAEERAALVRALEPLEHASLHLSSDNLGFGAGINMLAAKAPVHADDHIWILNPDIEAPPVTVSRFERSLQEGQFDVVAPIISTGSAKDVVWYRGGSVDARRAIVRHDGQGTTSSANDGKPPFATDFITGASMYMSAETWSRLDGFSERYFLYWEDADWCVRAAGAGLRLGVDPAITVWHAVGKSSAHEGRSQTYYYFMARNRFLFARERAGSARGLYTGIGLMETLRLMARAAREPGRKAPRVRAVLKGTMHGAFSLRGAA